MTTNRSLPTLLATFVTDRLVRQQRASPHTVASSRHPFSWLVRCAPQRLGTAPSALTLDDLEAPVLGSLLEHLEHARGTSARSRHVRLAAMHACFHVASRRAPSQGGVIPRVWASPRQRDDRPPIAFLPGAAIDALLAVPDPHTWAGRRARTLRLVAVQIGLRVSALIGLCWPDVTCGTGAHVSCPGTGRKTRCTPRRQDVITAWRAWPRAQRNRPEAPVLPSTGGGPLRRDGVAYRRAKHVRMAQQPCPSWPGKRVSPPVLRHSVAMALLHSGVDGAVIALGLGHESMDTTQMYLHARLELTQQALDKTTPVNGRPGRYQPDDERFAFLKGL